VWQGLGVTIVLWLALFLMRRRSAALRYAMSCAALALLVAMPAVTTWILYERPAPPAPIAATPFAAAVRTAPPVAPADPRVHWLGLVETWTIPVWSCGVLLLSIRMVWGCGRIAALRRRGDTPDARLVAMLGALAKRMRVTRPVRLLLSPITDSPSVTGWLRPVILLPLSAIAGLTPDQLEAVLAHELAHIRRHDYLVNLLQMAAETLLFYHPAVWWISARIRHERELCCDDLAVQACGGALCYARALTALEKMRAARPALALGSTDGPLFLRIRRLVVGGGEYGPSKLSGVVALSLGIACLALCVNWAHGQEPARGFAVTIHSEQDADGITVDTAGAALLHRTGVEYPRSLAARQVEGTVSVEANLDATGAVIDAHVLSGPDELRKPALSSVLNWHFAPGSGNTRVVKISFSAPSTPAEPERKTAERKSGEVRVRVRPQEEPDGSQTVVLEGEAERRQRALAHLAELQRQQAAASEAATQPEERTVSLRTEPANPERALVLERREASRREAERVGRPLAAIEIRGMSDQAGNDLLSRLPVHEGDTLTRESIEAAGRAIRQFDEHLEFNYGREPEGVVLRIHPAGAAGAPLLQRK
jgi:beta-lactamase regulating signal transducer with metallopeptidase domain